MERRKEGGSGEASLLCLGGETPNPKLRGVERLLPSGRRSGLGLDPETLNPKFREGRSGLRRVGLEVKIYRPLCFGFEQVQTMCILQKIINTVYGDIQCKYI